MKMFRKICTIMVIVALFGQLAVPVFGGTALSPWAKREYEMAKNLNIIPEKILATPPSDAITRENFSVATVGIIEKYLKKNMPFNPEKNFVDTDSIVIAKIYSAGIVNGRGEKIFDPDAPITRQEMGKILCNSLKYCKVNLTKFDEIEKLYTYSDWETVLEWARNSMEVMLREGIFRGVEDNKLEPFRFVSNETAMVMLYRVVAKFGMIKLPTTPVVTDKFDVSNITTEEIAKTQMEEVCVNVWKINKNGEKYASKAYITVHKKLVTQVKSIFEEIFNGKEKFPIKDVGGYNWRGDGTSEHNFGTAIDINYRENYCIYKDGTTIGDYWKPGVDPYSIPENGDVANAFKKFGWTWGGFAWTNPKDFMHFSYFGR